MEGTKPAGGAGAVVVVVAGSARQAGLLATELTKAGVRVAVLDAAAEGDDDPAPGVAAAMEMLAELFERSGQPDRKGNPHLEYG